MGETNTVIPQHLLRDRYWKGTLHLFANHPKLKMYFTTKYFDLQRNMIKVAALKKVSAPWSESEKFVLKLALHLYNERNTVNISDMDYLDCEGKAIAMEAIRLRFG